MHLKPIQLDKEQEEGNIYGYVTDVRDEFLANYLEEQDAFEIVRDIRQRYSRVAILTNVYVEEEHRGNGLGNEFVSDFLDKAYGHECEAVLLVADTLDSNPFSIVKWYEEWGFQILTGDRQYCPLMVHETEL